MGSTNSTTTTTTTDPTERPARKGKATGKATAKPDKPAKPAKLPRNEKLSAFAGQILNGGVKALANAGDLTQIDGKQISAMFSALNSANRAAR